MKPPAIATNNLNIKEQEKKNIEAITLNMNKLNSHLEESCSFSTLAQNTSIPWLKRFVGLSESQILSIISLEFHSIDKNSPSFSTSNASLNFEKNRYKDVLPWDYNIVQLQDSSYPISLYNGQNYINASYIQPEFTKNRNEFDKNNSTLIATQGPLPETIKDFWTLVYNQNLSFIYNLTCEEEGGRVKCAKYWPNLNQEFNFSGLVVRSEGEKRNSGWTCHTLSLFYNGNIKRIEMYHFEDWPDHSGSDSKKVLELVKTCIPLYQSRTRILVHCSAGVGRTGTFITLLYILSLLGKESNETGKEAVGQEESLVFRVVCRLRAQRIFSVQSLEQFIFIYRVILSRLNE